MRFFLFIFLSSTLLPLCGYGQVLSSTVPVRQSLSGSRTGPITLTFSQPVANPAPIRVNTGQRQGNRVGTLIGAGTNQITFQPAQPFAPGERVSITVPASVSSPAQVIEFRAAAGRGTATFGAPVTVGPPPSEQPSIVVAGDLDGDGDLDLVVGENLGARLCFNDGQGLFTPQASLVAIASPAEDLRLADFNGDGKLDLLASSRYNSEVSLNLGNGQGSFLARTTLLTPSFTAQIITGDFNADGLSDAVAAEVAGSGVVLRFLPGSTSGLGAPVYNSPATLPARDLGAADMDEDGDLDLLLITDATLGIYLNDGSGRFTAGPTTPINPFSATLTTGDFTGDGHVDVVCSSYQSANVSLVPGTGTGGLLPVQSIPALSRTWHVSSADMDGDADLDLLVTNDRGITQVLLNNGQGQFAAASAILIGFEAFQMAEAADLNGDGVLDVYTGHGVLNSPMPHGIDLFFNQPATVTGTAAPLATAGSTLFPNPAHEQVTLALPVSTGAVSIELRDGLGRMVRSLPAQLPTATHTIAISLTGISSGVYSVFSYSQNGRSVQRLVVE